MNPVRIVFNLFCPQMIIWYRGLSGIRYFHYNIYTVYISAIVALAIIIVMIPTATVLASKSDKKTVNFIMKMVILNHKLKYQQ